MKKLDLTNPDDILEFANNYESHKDFVSLPESVKQEIKQSIEHYQIGYITAEELRNFIASHIVDLWSI